MTQDRSPLRAAIDATDRFDRHVHHLIVAQLAHDYPHRIEYRGLQEDGNCATFALGLTQNAIHAESGDARTIVAGRAFVESLIDNHLVELDAPVLGSLALYFFEKLWQHAGVVAAPGRIVSQWGKYPVYEHAVLEVPSGYGDQVRYFEMIDPVEALRLFRKYAKTVRRCELNEAQASPLPQQALYSRRHLAEYGFAGRRSGFLLNELLAS